MEFDNIDNLFKYLDKQIKTATRNTAPKIKKKMQESIKKSVYNAYTPKVYNRRYYNDGLIDADNITVTELIDGIQLVNDAPLNNYGYIGDYRLDDIIVNGMGYQPFGRDFYKQTVTDLEASEEHITELKKQLKKLGIDVQ